MKFLNSNPADGACIGSLQESSLNAFHRPWRPPGCRHTCACLTLSKGTRQASILANKKVPVIQASGVQESKHGIVAASLVLMTMGIIRAWIIAKPAESPTPEHYKTRQAMPHTNQYTSLMLPHSYYKPK